MPGKEKNGASYSLAGVKNTRHRKAVLEVLGSSETPMTAEDIYLALKKIKDTTSLSTVYRSVEMLSGVGVVIKSNLLDDHRTRFELNYHRHKHYASCINCHQMIIIEDCPFTELEKKLQRKTGFHVTEHRLEITGYCRNCRPIT